MSAYPLANTGKFNWERFNDGGTYFYKKPWINFQANFGELWFEQNIALILEKCNFSQKSEEKKKSAYTIVEQKCPNTVKSSSLLFQIIEREKWFAGFPVPTLGMLGSKTTAV